MRRCTRLSYTEVLKSSWLVGGAQEDTALCFNRCDNATCLHDWGLPLMLAVSSPKDYLLMNVGCALLARFFDFREPGNCINRQ